MQQLRLGAMSNEFFARVAVGSLPLIGCVSESTVVMLILEAPSLTSVLTTFPSRHDLLIVEDISITASVLRIQ